MFCVRILILQPMLKFYRVAFYHELNSLLTARGHQLRVVFGTPSAEESKRRDNSELFLDFCHFERSYWLLGNRLHVHSNSLRHVLWADLIITEQANKHFYNYLLYLLRALRVKRFCLWGHGFNRQGEARNWREAFKKYLAVHTDWWFAYSASVVDYLVGLGFAPNKITQLNNSIDTVVFKRGLSAVTEAELLDFKRRQRIAGEARVGLFCGSLHKDKHVEFLLQAALKIRLAEPNFVLLLIGDGQDRDIVQRYADHYEFIKPLGMLIGAEKCLAFRSAEALLIPGMVGLGILDGFCAGLPLFTTRHTLHSPEIDYLRPGYNGLCSDFQVDAYAALVAAALADSERLAALRRHALESSNHYSIQQMAWNFAAGVEGCIAALGLSASKY